MSNEAKLLKVVGENQIECGYCEQIIRDTLKQLPGVQQVQTSCNTQLIRVTFNPGIIDMSHIQQKLEEIGYEVIETEALR